MSKMHMMGLMLGALALSSGSHIHSPIALTEEDPETKKRRLAKAEIERNKTNGLKEFFYGQNSVWALNQKNADKKAKRNNWI